MIREIKQKLPTSGVKEVLLLGEIDWRKRVARLQNGIQIPQANLDNLKNEGELCGVPFFI